MRELILVNQDSAQNLQIVLSDQTSFHFFSCLDCQLKMMHRTHKSGATHRHYYRGITMEAFRYIKIIFLDT